MSNKTVASISTNQCTGCGMCSVKCPQSCIEMLPDEEGFLFPSINESKCVSCGLCLTDCPATYASDSLIHNEQITYFSAIINDDDLLLKSSSGGVFGILAKHIIEVGGYVCGCVYDEKMNAVHTVTNEWSCVKKMFGSKYVQSRAYICFNEIKKILLEGNKLLFTGTACQIAALRNFLVEDYSSLICVEILCHGVPSPMLFSQYVRYLEKKLSGRVIDIQFRNKEKHGWGSEHRTCVVYEKKGVIKKYRPILPAYFSAFFYGLNLRESCYQCKFAKKERIADLTLGDFWGAFAKYGKNFEEGISVVGVNSTEGHKLIDLVCNQFKLYEFLTEEQAIRSNDNFRHPIRRPTERDNFYKNRKNKGYYGLWRKAYLSKTYRRKTLASIYGAFVPAKIRFALHRKKRKY